MKLKVPVNSYAAAVKQIEAGADEIYMGLEDAHFTRMSYSARAQIVSSGIHSNLTEDEFIKSVEYAHSKNVIVNFTANCQHVTKSENNFYRKGYIEYVRRGIALGADALIVADIGNLIALRKYGIETPVIAGSYFNCFNRETVHFLKQLHVFRVCVPDQVTYSEIKALKESTDLEIEIFVGYGCSNIAGMCKFYHNSGETIHIGVPCRAKFNRNGQESINILDACPDCAICSIPKLYDLGIDSLKLIGREMPIEEVVQVTKMYHTAIKQYITTGTLNKNEIISSISWWEDSMCCERCKYEDTPLTRSYI